MRRSSRFHRPEVSSGATTGSAPDPRQGTTWHLAPLVQRLARFRYCGVTTIASARSSARSKSLVRVGEARQPLRSSTSDCGGSPMAGASRGARAPEGAQVRHVDVQHFGARARPRAQTKGSAGSRARTRRTRPGSAEPPGRQLLAGARDAQYPTSCPASRCAFARSPRKRSMPPATGGGACRCAVSASLVHRLIFACHSRRLGSHPRCGWRSRCPRSPRPCAEPVVSEARAKARALGSSFTSTSRTSRAPADPRS